MKISAPSIVVFLTGIVCSQASDNSTGYWGFPFNPQGIEISWEAPTNQPPDKLWTYKIVPQVFSPPVISNAMAIGGFSPKDKKRFSVREYPFNHREMRRFTNEEETKYLVIFSPHGWMRYSDDGVVALGRTPVEGVPSEQEVMARALEILVSLGINKDELCLSFGKCGSSELQWMRKTALSSLRTLRASEQFA